MLDFPAPALHVDWVLLPQHEPPALVHKDGRRTVVVFDTDSRKPTEIAKTVADLEKVCANSDAVPIVIFGPEATEVGVRARFADKAKTASIGIDQFLADSNPNDIDGTTVMSYAAHQNGTRVYIIDSDGTVLDAQNGLAGLNAALMK